MWKFVSAIAVLAMGAFLASCDLQPKISSIPDSVGDFISARYPALLADPNTEPEIYNSAISDYGVYASPELYGSADGGDYVNYAGVNDYVLPTDDESAVKDEDVTTDESTDDDDVDDTDESGDEQENETPDESSDADVIVVNEYEPDEIYVPARAASGTMIVRRGDTLYVIAREYGMTLDEIAKLNNLSAPYNIRVGQVLKIEHEVPAVKEPIKQEPPKQDIKTKEPEPSPKPAKNAESLPKADAKPKTDIRVPVKSVTVARGDTLYSISRQYSVPVNDLAVMNNLSAPFNLGVGQVLRVPDLSARGATTAETTVKPKVVKENVAKKTDAKPVPKQEQLKQKVDPKKVAEQPKKAVEQKSSPKETKKADVKKTATKKIETKKSEVKKKEIVKKPVVAPKKETPKKETAKPVAQPPKIAARSSSKFSWPVRGTVLSHYGAKDSGLYNDGINISAPLNTSVLAAENGVVAYAGNEVRGMGNLIIIQHADGWMTVYAHMNSMSVRRGARVSVGQKIGTVGKTGRIGTPQLHFEIRKGTKSYNPVNYLKK